jgi:beta-mannosidase
MAQTKTFRYLEDNWVFNQVGKDSIFKAKVPGVVHTDLLKNSFIDDPWYGTNEKKLQWIEEKNWIYKCRFIISAEEIKSENIDLLFEGLDTYADVFLNGFAILSADNMFRSWKIEVKSKLKIGENQLEIRFTNPVEKNKTKLQSVGYQLPAGCETVPIKVSPFTRKAAYHFGWDWGPRYVTMGIWKPVKLIYWNKVEISDFQVVQKYLSQKKAVLEYIVDIHTSQKGTYNLQINNQIHSITIDKKDSIFILRDSITNPEFWWPNGWGDQKLYDVKVSLADSDVVLDSKQKKIGLRTIELVQNEEKNGRGFYFKVNGIPIFIKGANYIPQSNFLTEVSDEQYIELIEDAKKAQMNMLRVWGGGIYEKDIFYDLCDEKGILVWQDFMFAGSMYPGDDAFLTNVKNEVREQIVRLRDHPSLALWNGNNEINVAWFNWGWQKSLGYSAADSIKIRRDYEKIFTELIPEQIKALDSNHFYTHTSPLSNWGKPENFNYGSMHYWGVWHGKDNFDDYKKNVGRFMAEYGFQSFPELSTIQKFADSTQFSLDSEVMKWHQKSYVGNGIIAAQIEKYFGKAIDFKDFLIKSQKTQTLAMQMAIDAHRLKKGHCWGTLFWQFNDCWPGPSWSCRDVYGNQKEFYKKLAILFAPVALIPERKNDSLFIHLVNDHRINQKVEIEIKGSDGAILYRKKINIKTNQNLKVWETSTQKDFTLSIKKRNEIVFYRESDFLKLSSLNLKK